MKYSKKASSSTKRYMHLTNYSVNKHSKHFIKNTGAENSGIGSKWSIRALRAYLAKEGIDDEKVWANIEGLVIKTLMAVEPDVLIRSKQYGITRNNCFEVMGFDVLLDHSLKPWLLEVNTSPSLSSSSPLDKYIKTQLMTDAMHCCGVPPVDGKKELERSNKKARKLGSVREKGPSASEIQKLRLMGDKLDPDMISKYDLLVLRETYQEQQRCGHFKPIYPTADNCQKYDHLFRCNRYNNLLLRKFERMSKREQMKILTTTKTVGNIKSLLQRSRAKRVYPGLLSPGTPNRVSRLSVSADVKRRQPTPSPKYSKIVSMYASNFSNKREKTRSVASSGQSTPTRSGGNSPAVGAIKLQINVPMIDLSTENIPLSGRSDARVFSATRARTSYSQSPRGIFLRKNESKYDNSARVKTRTTNYYYSNGNFGMDVRTKSSARGSARRQHSARGSSRGGGFAYTAKKPPRYQKGHINMVQVHSLLKRT